MITRKRAYQLRALIEQAEDSLSDYQSATNWSVIPGYTNNSITSIEGSIYETKYADGTPIQSN